MWSCPAAGVDAARYWAMFRVHRSRETFELLETMRIGNVAAADRVPDVPEKEDDPFSTDPQRDKDLVVRAAKPFNAETPLEVIAESFITPTPKFFVRNHLPVPVVDVEAYELVIDGLGIREPVRLTLEDLKTKFPQQTIVAAVVCGGNRRRDMSNVMGLSWDVGAVGNATWTGVPLRELLRHAGLDVSDTRIKHVEFVGLDTRNPDPYSASIPLQKALDGERHAA